MKFTCDTKALQEGLQIATKALSSRTTNPVLQSILIESDMGRLVLTCSDELITIVTRIDADIQDPGRGIVPGRLFSEIVRRLGDGFVTVTMDNSFRFTLVSENSRTNISGQDPDLFPLLPRIDTEHEVTLPQSMLRDMIEKTEFAIAVEDMREVLTGALLEMNGGNINMVGLDGFRLAMCTYPGSNLPDNCSAIIPGRAIGEIGKLLSEDEDKMTTLTFGGNKLRIDLGDTEIYAVLIDGKFIQYRQIIPTSFKTKFTAPLEIFRRCVDRAALIAKEGSNNLITLETQQGLLVMESHSQIGDVHEELDIEQEGEDIRISFNVKYLTDVVRFIGGERIEMNMESPVRPCVVNPEGDKNYIHLILPVRTGR